jgi:hypothetical protein
MLALRSLRPASSRLSAFTFARTFTARAQPKDLNEGEATIWGKLNDRFPGTRLEVQDVSGKSAVRYGWVGY